MPSSESDEQDGGANFVEQALGDLHQIRVAERIVITRFVGYASEFESFFAIGRDERKAAQIQGVNGLGIEAKPDAVFATERFELLQKALSDDAFSVVTND